MPRPTTRHRDPLRARALELHVACRGQPARGRAAAAGTLQRRQRARGGGGGHALGVDLEPLLGALEQGVTVPGRLEPVDEGQRFAVLVDYAHTPDSLENVLVAAREMIAGPAARAAACCACSAPAATATAASAR